MDYIWSQLTNTLFWFFIVPWLSFGGLLSIWVIPKGWQYVWGFFIGSVSQLITIISQL